MSWTALQLLTDAARTLGVIASGESLSTDEQNDGLNSLNKLIDSWSAEGTPLVQLTKTTIATGGAGPFTTPRPIKIKAAYCSSGPLSSPVEVCSAEQWSEIVDESRSGTYATKMFCDYAYPTSNIYVWPAATASLVIQAFMPLTTFAALATSIDLPPGYPRGLTLNLALDLAEQFGRPVTQSLMANAQQSKALIIQTSAAIFGASPAPNQALPKAA